MRTALILVLIACAPSLFAGRLETNELLAGLKPAHAAEARWIVECTTFAPDIIGIDASETRSGIALRRLIAEKDVSIFERMMLTRHGAAACYAIEGISKLDPAQLPRWIEHCIGYRQPFYEAHGDIGHSTSTLYVLLEHIDEHRIPVKAELWTGAWSRLLKLVSEEGARLLDLDVAQTIAERLGKLPESDQNVDASVRTYAEFFLLESPIDELWRIAREEYATDAGRLAMEWLARNRIQRERPVVRLEFGSPDKELAADIRVGLRAVRIAWEHLCGPDDSIDAWPWATFSLRRVEKDSLLKHESASVRRLARKLFEHPYFSVTRAFNPDDDEGLHQAHLFRSIAQLDVDSSSAVGRQNILNAFDHAPAAFSGRLSWEGESVFEIIAREWGGNYGPLIKSAIKACESDNLEARRAGAGMIWGLEGRYQGHEERLFKVGHWLLHNTEGPDKWLLRDCVLSLRKVVPEDDKVFQKTWAEAATRWSRELAEELVNHPRRMPPAHNPHLNEAFRNLPGWPRAVIILDSIYDGHHYFLPDDDLPEERFDEDEDKLTATTIYERMQAALAKLPD